jgi:dihydrofolate reductase
MRKLVESTFMSLDGVISNPQEWSPPYWDDEHAQYARDILFLADALLLGRKTYEAFVQAWPSRTGDEYSDRINAMAKYVASRTLDPSEAEWNATVLEGDVAEVVASLKEQPGENILKFGTGELSKTLLEHKLVDEYHFWVFPVVVGSGDRLFEGARASLSLQGETTFKSGIVVLRYGPKS